jgi:Bacteriophage holin.
MELSARIHILRWAQNIIYNGGFMEQNRFKSWALWTAIAALVVFCVKEFAGLDIEPTVNGLLDVLLPVLIGLGVINNPTDKTKL